MDWACAVNGAGQNCQSSGQMDTTTWLKKARPTSYRLVTDGEARHKMREFSWEQATELEVDRIAWKKLIALCVTSNKESKS